MSGYWHVVLWLLVCVGVMETENLLSRRAAARKRQALIDAVNNPKEKP